MREVEDSGRVSLPGFFTITRVERDGRIARNPQNGVSVDVPPRKDVRFKPGKRFKEVVNGNRESIPTPRSRYGKEVETSTII